jgi:hypothetical protein
MTVSGIVLHKAPKVKLKKYEKFWEAWQSFADSLTSVPALSLAGKGTVVGGETLHTIYAASPVSSVAERAVYIPH